MGLPQEDVLADFRPYEDLPALSLDERGMIRDCNRAAERLSGYFRGELIWRHVSLLLPELAGSSLLPGGSLNPKLSFLCRCGHLFHLHDRVGRCMNSELHLVELGNSGRRTVRLLVRPVTHQ